MPSLTDTISLNTTIGAIQSAHTTACILGHGDSAREHQRWGSAERYSSPARAPSTRGTIRNSLARLPVEPFVRCRSGYFDVFFLNFNIRRIASSTFGQAIDPGAISSKCDAFSTTIRRHHRLSQSLHTSFPSPAAHLVLRSGINTCLTPIGKRFDGEPSRYLSGTSDGEPPIRFVITGHHKPGSRSVENFPGLPVLQD